jgi:hypothetical protein
MCACWAQDTPSNAGDIDEVKELSQTTFEIKDAILKNDTKRLMQYIDVDGLTCTDSVTPYSKVQSMLKDKTSPLYLSLFESEQFARQCGESYPDEYPAISDKEFFLKAQDFKIDVSSLEPGWAQVKIESTVKSYAPRIWTFHRHKGKWKMSNGFLTECGCA